MDYNYSKIKDNIYNIEVDSDVRCVACFRSGKSWKIQTLDFGSVSKSISEKDIHPVVVDYETKIDGIDFRRIYNTLASICIEHIKAHDKIICLKSNEPVKQRLIRMFMNQNQNRAKDIFDYYGVINEKQIKYDSKIDFDIIMLVPKKKQEEFNS